MADKGHPRAFKDDNAFRDKFLEYVKYCNKEERFPTIVGFCVFADITRETYYKQKEYYSDTYLKTRHMLEDEIWQDKTHRGPLYLKSVFGHTDRQQVTSENTNKNVNLEVDSIEEADRIIKEFNKKKIMGLDGRD